MPLDSRNCDYFQVISLVQTGNTPSADMLVNLGTMNNSRRMPTCFTVSHTCVLCLLCYFWLADIKNISPPIMEGLDEMLSVWFTYIYTLEKSYQNDEILYSRIHCFLISSFFFQVEKKLEEVDVNMDSKCLSINDGFIHFLNKFEQKLTSINFSFENFSSSSSRRASGTVISTVFKEAGEEGGTWAQLYSLIFYLWYFYTFCMKHIGNVCLPIIHLFQEHSVQVESSHFTSIIDGLQKLYTEN